MVSASSTVTRFFGGFVFVTFVFNGCTKEAERQQPAGKRQMPAVIPSRAETKGPASGPPSGPSGDIYGKITITGTIPEMPVLSRGADPKCSGNMRAETVLASPTGGLSNVMVRITSDTVPRWVPPEKIVVDQIDCMYRPRVQGGVRGQTVQVKNSDDTTHNVHIRNLPLDQREGTETIVNQAQPAGLAMTFKLGAEPVSKLKCDFHSWMRGYIVGNENPYFSVSDRDGAFVIENVPVGTHSVEAWHEFYGLKKSQLVVEKGGRTSIEFVYHAAGDSPSAQRGAK